jgi:hypothetical protein
MKKLLNLIFPIIIALFIIFFTGERIESIEFVISGEEYISTSDTDDHIVIFGGQVEIDEEVELNKSLVQFGGNLDYSGKHTSDLYQLSGEISFSNYEEGPGNFYSFGGSYETSSSDTEEIVSEISIADFFENLNTEESDTGFSATYLVKRATLVLIATTLGLLINKRYHENFKNIYKGLRNKALLDLAIGLVTILVVPNFIILLLYTGILIPLSIILIFLSLLLFFLSYLILGLVIQNKVFQTSEPFSVRSFIYTLASFLTLEIVLTLLNQIPFIGSLVILLAFVTIVGELLRSRFGVISK